MKSFDEYTISLVLKAYLIDGRSHREIQREILHLPAPARGGGFRTMIILHEYGIKGQHKAIFQSQVDPDAGIDKHAIDLLQEYLRTEIEIDEFLENNINPNGKGTVRESIIRVRVFQEKLRKKTIINYNNECAICDINKPDLLVCSHIIPWSFEEKTRLDLQNSICLCFFHDRLFDKGYWTLSENNEIILSKRVDKSLMEFFINKKFKSPIKFSPNIEFLKFHRSEIFK